MCKLCDIRNVTNYTWQRPRGFPSTPIVRRLNKNLRKKKKLNKEKWHECNINAVFYELLEII